MRYDEKQNPTSNMLHDFVEASRPALHEVRPQFLASACKRLAGEQALGPGGSARWLMLAMTCPTPGGPGSRAQVGRQLRPDHTRCTSGTHRAT